MKDEIEGLQKEVTHLKNSRDRELQQLYSRQKKIKIKIELSLIFFYCRIKLSVARKDEILNELQIEHKALQEKCIYLENMLEQQRKEYLIQ